MSLSPESRAKLLDATREAAAAFVEDMSHIREVLNRTDPVRGELRRLSSVLRRLLIDNGGDLPDIATPRIGRVMLSAPDNKPVYRAEKTNPYEFFGSGGAAAFGIMLRAHIVERGRGIRKLENFDPDKTVELRIDGFLSQHVLCLQGSWITRRSVIKYVANVASGVHSGSAKDEEEKLLARLRRCVTYSLRDGSAAIAFDPNGLSTAGASFQYTQDAIDPILFELLAASYYLAASPYIGKLESSIREELGLNQQ